jgi:hypothetical protein
MPGQDLWPLPGGVADECTGGVIGKVFTSERVLLAVSFAAARARLERLAADGVLLGASKCAYGAGIAALAEEAGPAAGTTRLAGVQAVGIGDAPDSARLGLRWDAIGSDGSLFPALDADLTLSACGKGTTVLTLAGVYRLPRQVAAGLDPDVAHCHASVTMRSFVARLACALMHPAGAGLR